MKRFSRALLPLLAALSIPTPARAVYLYEWHGAVTFAESYGEDELGNWGAYLSPIGGDITVALRLNDAFRPGDGVEFRSFHDVKVESPGADFDAPPLLIAHLTGHMPETEGPGYLELFAPNGHLYVHESSFNAFWRGCLRDAPVPLVHCDGFRVDGLGGPWTYVGQFSIPEPGAVPMFAIMLALLCSLLGPMRKRPDAVGTVHTPHSRSTPCLDRAALFT